MSQATSASRVRITMVRCLDAGREVLRMYARLRGVAVASREALAERLLQRLGLARYADR